MSVRRAEMFGCPLDLLTMDESVARCAELVRTGESAQHVVVNAGKYVAMHDDSRLREIVSGCEIINADGMSVVWAGRLLGIPVPERVAGIDLMEKMLEVASDEAWPVFFLGATSDVLEEFVGRVRERFPQLQVAGRAHGYFSAGQEIAASIRESGARILLVGMSSPRKEYFIDDFRDELGALLAIGVGGSFDVWAGKTKRAPAWMQRTGLEWLYRLLQEPRRMWRRYLVGNGRFIAMTLREALRRRG